MNTYANAIAAAKVWGAQHGVVGRSGGYLLAKDDEAYAALPEWLKFRAEGTALVINSATRKGRQVQGWGDLAGVLRKHGALVAVPPPAHYTLGRTRYAIA